MNKKVIFALVGLVVILVAVGIYKKGSSSEAVKVTSEEVEKRSIIETVSANGKVRPELEVIISPEISGEVIELNVKEGDSVQQGDLLVKINPDIFESALRRAEASMNSVRANEANARARLAQSKAQLINAEATFKRQKQLNEEGVISPAEYDQAFANFEVAKADVQAAEESLKGAQYNVKSAEATMSEAKDNLSRTSIIAPISGTVSKLNIEKGERVVGTSQMAGTEMLRIADLTRMEVEVEVNESDIVKVKIGDDADIEVDAYVDHLFRGVVTEIASSSSESGMMSADQVTIFNVKVLINEDSYQDLLDATKPNESPFKPGMSATVDVITEQADDVIAVPIQSVTVRADSVTKNKYGKVNLDDVDEEDIKTCVFVLEDGKAKKVFVQTGIQDTRFMQIMSGLDEGAKVITGPYTVLTNELIDGDAVESVALEAVFSKD